jgi:hypothetical protein
MGVQLGFGFVQGAKGLFERLGALAFKVPTDVTEDVVRAEALKLDLVDVKVAAVDNVWSGLKLVIRVDQR